MTISSRLSCALASAVSLIAIFAAGCGDDAASSPVRHLSAPRNDAGASAPPSTGGGEDPGGSSPLDAGAPLPPGDDDAGAPPSNAPEAGAPSTTGGAGCAGAMLCDDFEAATVGQAPPAPWTIATPNCSGQGKLAVDGTQAHSGTRSIKVSGAGGYCNHVFLATAAPASIASVVWGRFWMRLGSALEDGHVTFLALKDTREGKDVRMGGQNKVLMWNRESDDATLPEMSPAGTAKSLAPPALAWKCVEFQIDTTNGTLRTWVDGAAVDGLVADGTPTADVDTQWLRKAGYAPRPADARFGWESYGGQANDVWFDDIAFDAKRVGCGP